eukprot:scaffold94358_cov65-Phaeocystis_antarctica.AAC.3
MKARVGLRDKPSARSCRRRPRPRPAGDYYRAAVEQQRDLCMRLLARQMHPQGRLPQAEAVSRSKLVGQPKH